MRTPVIAGNWKMFKTVEETVRFFDELKPLVADVDHCEIVIGVPFPSLTAASEAVRGSRIKIAAQNLHWEDEGAFTGEVSGRMIRGAGADYVIIGHSERRQYFGETDKTVNERIRAAFRSELTAIVCVGETLQEREAEKTEDVLKTQFAGGLAGLTAADLSRIIVAYEPVWAIGTGRTATPRMAADAHRFIRSQAAELFGSAAAEALRILYGGSVKPESVASLMEREDIDGGLVGGASLKADSFARIVRYNQAES